MSHLVISVLRGNAGAGGAMLALVADKIFASDRVVLNPHYRSMGGLEDSMAQNIGLIRYRDAAGGKRQFRLRKGVSKWGRGKPRPLDL